MELRRVRCTQCGAEFDNFDPTARVMRCNRMGCGAVFVVEQGVRFAEVDEKEADEIGKIRKAMEKAASAHNHELVYSHATSIQEMLPDDFTANFWLSLLSVRLYDKHPAIYEDFLRSDCAATDDEVEKCAKYAIENAVENDVDILREFFKTRFSEEAAKKKLSALRTRMLRLHELEKKSGDLFILSGRSGGKIADEFYGKLRRAGVSCWSERQNLSKDVTGYNARIEAAAKSCKAMLIIATTALSASTISRELIKDAKAGNVPLIVLKTEGAELTHSFEKLIEDARIISCADEKAAECVINAVKELLNPEKPKENVKKTEKPAPAIELDVPDMPSEEPEVSEEIASQLKPPALKPFTPIEEDIFMGPPSFDAFEADLRKKSEELKASKKKKSARGLIFDSTEEDDAPFSPPPLDAAKAKARPSGLVYKDSEKEDIFVPPSLNEEEDVFAPPTLMEF